METKIDASEQQSGEWFAIRKGKMTASHAQAIGNCGKGLDTYIIELMADYYSSGEKEHFSNKHTDRGNELEPIARSMYELENMVDVEQVGFIYSDYVGVSPDGLVGDDGLIEIKCVNDTDYFKHVLNGESEIDTKYIWQAQMQLLVTGRKWNDVVFYNPNFEKSMCVYRLYPDQEKHQALKKGIEIGISKIKEIKQTYESKIG
jgi:putative phage-type endonuclease